MIPMLLAMSFASLRLQLSLPPSLLCLCVATGTASVTTVNFACALATALLLQLPFQLGGQTRGEALLQEPEWRRWGKLQR